MENSQQPYTPDDFVELAYLGLDLVFGDRVEPGRLMECAREATTRTSLYHRRWIAGEPFDDVQLSDAQALRLRGTLDEKRGLVICTFQIGPFLQLPFLLSKMGLPVMLLMDPENFESRMDSCAVQGIGRGGVPYGYWPKSDPAADAGITTQPVNFITSADQSAPWKMSQWLKAGKIVFAYLDGNRGVESEFNEKNSVVVPFYGTEIWVRKGLAYIAGFIGAPLMFLICRQEQSGHVVRLSSPLRKKEDETLDAFCQRSMRRAFRLLEAHIFRDVSCWNEWHQLQRWVVRRPATVGAFESLNLSPEQALQRNLRVEPQLIQIRYGDQDVLVNQKTGTAILLTPMIADVLRMAEGGSTVEAIITRLNSNYEEDSLLEVIYTLAKDAFLHVNLS